MATLKQRMCRKNTSGEYDIIHLETDWSCITGKPTTFPPSAHSHGWSEVTGKPSTFTPATHSHSEYAVTTHTHTPASIGAATSDHTHSGYAAANHSHSGYASSSHSHSWSSITSKPSTFTPSSHTHTASQCGALPTSGGSLTGDLRLDSDGYRGTLYFGQDDCVKIQRTDSSGYLRIDAVELDFVTSGGSPDCSSYPLPVEWGGTGCCDEYELKTYLKKLLGI